MVKEGEDESNVRIGGRATRRGKKNVEPWKRSGGRKRMRDKGATRERGW